MSTFKEEFRKYFSELLSDLELCNYDIVYKLKKDIKTLMEKAKEDKDNDEEDTEIFGDIFFFFTGEIKNMLLDSLLKLFEQEIKSYNKLYELLSDINIDYEDVFDTKNMELIRDKITNRIFENEHFIYYKDAIEYLSEEDCTLQDSLHLASEIGFDTKNLNSCVLANLLYNNNLSERYYEEEDTIRELLEFKEELVDKVMSVLIGCQ